MRRGEIRYAELGAAFGRRPVLIVTADEVIGVLSRITCAPVTTTLRDIATRVPVGRREGVRKKSEAACEALMTIPQELIDAAPLGELGASRFVELDRAIARALDIQRAHLLPR